MVSASKIVDRVPQLPDIHLPDLPIDMDDVTERLKDITGAASNAARQAADTTARRTERLPRTVTPAALVALLVVALGAFFLVKSRRSNSEPQT